MAIFTKINFSESTNGRNIKITQTATAGDSIHISHTTAKDEIWLWASNIDTVNRKLTIEFGGATSPDDLHEFTVPAEDGAYLIIPGWILTGGVTLAAFAASANVINVNGYVNRLS